MSKMIFSALTDNLRIKNMGECLVCESMTPLTFTFKGSPVWICSKCYEALLNKLMKTAFMDIPEEVDSVEKLQNWIREVLSMPQPKPKPKPKPKSSTKTIWW